MDLVAFKFRPSPLVMAMAAWFAGPAAAQNFALVGEPNRTHANGISADGRVVIGEHQASSEGWQAFRWSAAGGLQIMGTLGGNASMAYAANRDGSVIVGAAKRLDGEWRAFRWTASGMQDLGTLGGNASHAYAVSANGAVVAGKSFTDGDDWMTARAFRWTQAGGMQDLGTLGGTRSDARAVSADGAVVAGTSATDGVGADRAFRWTQATGMQSLGTLAGGAWSEAFGISADGNVVVGASEVSGLNYRAFRWTPSGGMEDLGTLAGGDLSNANAVSANGDVVVGAATVSGGSAWRAFRWTRSGGMQSVADWLAAAGVSVPSGLVLSEATGVDASGNVVVGNGIDDGWSSRAWLARVGPAGAGLLTDIAAFNASLLQTHRRAVQAAMDLANLPLFGAHHRTLLDNGLVRAADGACAWATADAAEYRPAETRMELFEAGACKVLGSWRLGVGVGHQTARQNWELGGSGRFDGNYLVVEAARAFAGGWEASALVWHGRFDGRLQRRYLNGASVDTSRGTPDVRATAWRLRLDWKDAARLGAFGLSPYASVTHTATEQEAYTETGGGFPAGYSGVNSKSDDLRLGIAAQGAISGMTLLRMALEANHRIDDTTDKGRGQTVDLLGLWRFELPGEKTKREWLRVTADIDHRLSDKSLLTFGASAATEGGDPHWSVTAGWRMAF
ncbi:MAG: autotransporter domain-containing protein [Azovibrio sp.]|nr:autotransporter domain-containing protein [Azovibrio sp.]